MNAPVKSFLILLFISFLYSCKPNMMISHGSSFGRCQGFCNKELQLFAKKTRFKTWENSDAKITNSLEVANMGTDFNKIISQLDLTNFKKLKSTYGCPDCADGGAEWIAVKTRRSTKRVTFEYGNPPGELKALNEQLRAIQQHYDKSK